jgi:hypothetical protein
MKLANVVAVAVLLLAPAATAAAQDLGTLRTQTLDVTISATDIFTVTAAPAMTVAADGVAHEKAGGTYSVATNAEATAKRKIQVKIATLIPDVTVRVKLDYEGDHGAGGTFVLLAADNTYVPVVTDIYASSSPGSAITYELTVPVTVPAGNPTRTVTYTLVAQ